MDGYIEPTCPVSSIGRSLCCSIPLKDRLSTSRQTPDLAGFFIGPIKLLVSHGSSKIITSGDTVCIMNIIIHS